MSHQSNYYIFRSRAESHFQRAQRSCNTGGRGRNRPVLEPENRKNGNRGKSLICSQKKKKKHIQDQHDGRQPLQMTMLLRVSKKKVVS